MRLHAGDQLRVGDRLDQVVIGPEIESAQLVLFTRLRCEDDDMDRDVVASHMGQHIEARHLVIGQPEIEQDQVRTKLGELFERFLAVARASGPISGVLHRQLVEPGRSVFVFDDQDAWSGHRRIRPTRQGLRAASVKIGLSWAAS